jgi:hypothetical protein
MRAVGLFYGTFTHQGGGPLLRRDGELEQLPSKAWGSYLEELRKSDLCAMPVDISGISDSSESYIRKDATFCHSLEELYATFENAGRMLSRVTDASKYPYVAEAAAASGLEAKDQRVGEERLPMLPLGLRMGESAQDGKLPSLPLGLRMGAPIAPV